MQAYETFTASGTFVVPPGGGTVEYLLVGGGGGGGTGGCLTRHGGAGGGGGGTSITFYNGAETLESRTVSGGAGGCPACTTTAGITSTPGLVERGPCGNREIPVGLGTGGNGMRHDCQPDNVPIPSGGGGMAGTCVTASMPIPAGTTTIRVSIGGGGRMG